MAVQKLRFHGVNIDHYAQPRAGDERPAPRIYLQLWTQGGQGREVDLTDDQLLKLIEEAAKCLRIRQRER